MENPTLLNGDCLELMKTIPDGSIDLVLTDLPYGLTANEKDIALPFDKLWAEWRRLAKPNAAFVLFAQGLFYVDMVQSNRKMFRYDLVWDKELTSGFLNANRMPMRRHEQIAVFYAKQPTYNPQMTEGAPNHDQGTKRYEKEMTNRNYGEFNPVETKKDGLKHPTSIVRFRKPHPSVALHRTEKPVDLLKWLVRTYTNEGDVVLDCCMGCGSTGVACAETGRKFVGIELDENYFRVAKDRLESPFDAFMER